MSRHLALCLLAIGPHSTARIYQACTCMCMPMSCQYVHGNVCVHPCVNVVRIICMHTCCTPGTGYADTLQIAVCLSMLFWTTEFSLNPKSAHAQLACAIQPVPCASIFAKSLQELAFIIYVGGRHRQTYPCIHMRMLTTPACMHVCLLYHPLHNACILHRAYTNTHYPAYSSNSHCHVLPCL